MECLLSSSLLVVGYKSRRRLRCRAIAAPNVRRRRRWSRLASRWDGKGVTTVGCLRIHQVGYERKDVVRVEARAQEDEAVTGRRTDSPCWRPQGEQQGWGAKRVAVGRRVTNGTADRENARRCANR